jgi:hypothetical protein
VIPARKHRDTDQWETCFIDVVGVHRRSTTRSEVVMFTIIEQPGRPPIPGAPRVAWRLAIACAAATALAVPMTGSAQARVETPQDTASESVATAKKIVPTRVAGLYGVKVRGGWLLR